MKRIGSLFVCLAIFGVGIALTSSAEAKPRRVRKQCCQTLPQSAPAPALVPSLCLQFLLYADDVIELWSADYYSTDVCLNPEEQYIFTMAGETGPQSCAENADPACSPENQALMGRPTMPVMKKPLNDDERYLNRLATKKVPVRRKVSGTPTKVSEWSPIDGLNNGEISAPMRKVLLPDGMTYIPIRLSRGKAEMRDIRYRPPLPNPHVSTKNPRDIKIGFEVQDYSGDVNQLDPATPGDWIRYENSQYAFTIVIDRGADKGKYHVLTKTAVKR